MDISSVNNEKVKFWQKLKQKKYRDLEKLFLIEDEHLLKEALSLNLVQEIITTNKNYQSALPVYYVNEKIMKLLATQVTGAKIIAVVKFLTPQKISGNILVLDDIQDPGNLGTMIRSAVAFNFQTIVVSKNTVSMYNPKVIRASEGMIFHVNIIERDLPEFLNNLDKSYLKITTSVSDGKNIGDLQFTKCAIIIGNEGAGVHEMVQKCCDEVVNIKMNPECESLNAGICASILMYEVNNG